LKKREKTKIDLLSPHEKEVCVIYQKRLLTNENKPQKETYEKNGKKNTVPTA